MKIVFSATILLLTFATNAQNYVERAEVKSLVLNCPPQFSFITNIEAGGSSCVFYYAKEEPRIFYVENFSHDDLYTLLVKKDFSKIQRAKLVQPENYIASVHDFVFTYGTGHVFYYYYVLKDEQEQRLLVP